MKSQSQHYSDLYKVLTAAQDEKEMKKLLADLLTPQELLAISERVQILKQLREGKPQRKIAEELGVSISTITRGSRVSQFGTKIVEEILKRIT